MQTSSLGRSSYATMPGSGGPVGKEAEQNQRNMLLLGGGAVAAIGAWYYIKSSPVRSTDPSLPLDSSPKCPEGSSHPSEGCRGRRRRFPPSRAAREASDLSYGFSMGSAR